MPLIFSIICILSIHTAYSLENHATVEFENAVWYLRVEESKKLQKTIKKKLTSQFPYKNYSILLPNGKTTVQINPQGQLTVLDNCKQRSIVKNSLGKIVLDTNQKQTDNMSLNEEKTIVLQPGSSVTLKSLLNNTKNPLSIKITYDKIIKLVSEVNSFELPVLHSVWAPSRLVSVAISQYAMKFRCLEDKEKVFLKEKLEEIQLLDCFLTLGEENRKKLLNRLPIPEHTTLLANLHVHCLIKEFGCNYYDLSRKSLENKICNSLKQAISQDVSSWPTAIKWFKTIQEWPLIEQSIIEDVLRRVIRPVPTVLFKKNNISKISFNLAETRAIIYYKDKGGAIINLENGDLLFEESNIKTMHLDFSYTKAIVCHLNGRGKIINLEDRSVIFDEYDAREMDLNSAHTKIAICKDNRGKIINIENGAVLFKNNNISYIDFNVAGTRAVIWYENNRGEIINLKNKEVLFEGNNITLISLNSTKTVVIAFYKDGKKTIIDLENGAVLFNKNNIEWIDLNSTKTKTIISYENNRRKIIDIESKKVLFDNAHIININFNSDDTRAAILYSNDKGKIINLENEKVLFEDRNIHSINLNSIGIKATVYYKNGERTIIDLNNGGIIFSDNNIINIDLNSTETRAVVWYQNGRGTITNLENGKIFFNDNNVENIMLNLAKSMAIVRYKGNRSKIIELKNGKVLFNITGLVDLNSTTKRAIVTHKDYVKEIIDLENYDRNIVFKELKPAQLLLIFSQKNPNFPGISSTITDNWKSFNFNLKQKLQDSYIQ